MKILSLDHMVLNVASVDAAVAFYHGVLGMRRQDFGDCRVALHFGSQKINLHRAEGETATPRARAPVPGSGDICLLVESLTAAQAALGAAGVEIALGPVDRSGARGPIRSIYCYDPDGNLVELSAYPNAGAP
ncbi:MAG: VOC family protein [Hyphomicrobiales bacterium]